MSGNIKATFVACGVCKDYVPLSQVIYDQDVADVVCQDCRRQLTYAQAWMKQKFSPAGFGGLGVMIIDIAGVYRGMDAGDNKTA